MRTILIIISIFIVFVSYSYIYFYIIAGTPSINVRKNVDVNKRIPIITNLIKKVSSVADCKLVLLYGTLLGQYRNNSIICYDYDADIGVFEEDYDKIVRNIIKEFGNNNGIIYVNEATEVVKRTLELIKNGGLAEQGLKAQRFVKRYSWDNITQDFEAILRHFLT